MMPLSARQLFDSAFVLWGAYLLRNAIRHHGQIVTWGAVEAMWFVEWAITTYLYAKQREAKRNA